MSKPLTPINIKDFSYELSEDRIAKFPLEKRENSKLLIYKAGHIEHQNFFNLPQVAPKDALLVFNNTKVIRARIIMHKSSGARIEIFCLEPTLPADYERAFAVQGKCQWQCIIGNAKKWKQDDLILEFEFESKSYQLRARRICSEQNNNQVEFEWDSPQSFGQLLEMLGRMPIPPYLNRESEQIDNTRYQTVYSKFEGSVAAPTAGLHFSEAVIADMKAQGFEFEQVTLHVGAGTFLPVKSEDATEHNMHTEHFELKKESLEKLIAKFGNVVAVGTTSVRTLESIMVLGARVLRGQDADPSRIIGQWEAYDRKPDEQDGLTLLKALHKYMTDKKLSSIKAATQIMITPGYKFRLVNTIITNFHQPQSTLLLLISAFVGQDWHKIYDYALANDFRFLSYGDSSILFKNEG